MPGPGDHDERNRHIGCSHCRVAWTAFQEIRRRQPERVAFVFRHYPMGYAYDAARAGVCADRQGKFEDLFDLLVEHEYRPPQRGTDEQVASIGGRSWNALAEDVGVADLEQFNACMDEENLPSVIEEDMEAGKELEIAAVPLILINDMLIRGNPGAETLDSIVTDILDRVPADNSVR